MLNYKGYDVYEAITREKRIKKWNCQWKLRRTILSGQIWPTDCFEGWFPAWAGMTEIFCHERNERPEKPFSGKFNLRITPELPREAYVAAKHSDMLFKAVFKTKIPFVLE